MLLCCCCRQVASVMSDSVRPHDDRPPGSPVPGILQARTLEWVATSFSNAWKWKGKVKLLSRVWLLATPWTAASQAPPSTGFSQQEYWSGLSLPSPHAPQWGLKLSLLWIISLHPWTSPQSPVKFLSKMLFIHLFFLSVLHFCLPCLTRSIDLPLRSPHNPLVQFCESLEVPGSSFWVSEKSKLFL